MSTYRGKHCLILKNLTGTPHIHSRHLDRTFAQQRKRDPESNGSRAGVETKLNWEKRRWTHKNTLKTGLLLPLGFKGKIR
ncbi:hypothetical protein XENORESO_013745 [Xenotaenia resolanae]|uniref:Uncharacterized protein n=1 Tax=Xenotaenia resolanae TaxID=208358 RepID=A0ABV0WJB9_9TELE